MSDTWTGDGPVTHEDEVANAEDAARLTRTDNGPRPEDGDQP